jgi:hypothetical protein
MEGIATMHSASGFITSGLSSQEKMKSIGHMSHDDNQPNNSLLCVCDFRRDLCCMGVLLWEDAPHVKKMQNTITSVFEKERHMCVQLWAFLRAHMLKDFLLVPRTTPSVYYQTPRAHYL